MVNYGGFYNPNQGILNQLMRQKDNVENMIQQYSQPQAPVQNIINAGTNLEFEARYLGDGEDVANVGIMRRTLFIDEKSKKIYIKEVDGTISKEYEIIVPMDKKDMKILELETRLKEMEEKINAKYTEPIRTDDVKQQSDELINVDAQSSAKTIGKSVSKSTK